MNSKEIIKMIEADGWQLLRAKGSHHHFKHPIKKGLVTIPHPKRTLPKGTVSNILKQAELKEEVNPEISCCYTKRRRFLLRRNSA